MAKRQMAAMLARLIRNANALLRSRKIHAALCVIAGLPRDIGEGGTAWRNRLDPDVTS